MSVRRLKTLLAKRPMTATQIARVLGVSKPTAYARVKQLQKLETVVVEDATTRQPGPVAKTYRLVR